MRNTHRAGFTLIDIMVGIALFSIISFGIYGVYANILNSIVRNQWRTFAVAILENQLETIRGMKFEDVGIVGGYPAGKIPASSIVFQAGVPFLLTSTVRAVDDPFDGTATSTPRDTSPADYKIVELTATCRIETCITFKPITVTTTVAPNTGLETASNNGSMFITTFDAYGKPVPNADVTVTNTALTPHILVQDATNNDGFLALLDFPTSTMSYNVRVSKAGYSSEQTYPLGGASNPNPLKTDATIAQQQITSLSFAIDKVSTLSLSARDAFCIPVANNSFSIKGSKLIGTTPDVLKYTNTVSTNGSGNANITNLEWDSYQITNTASSSYNVAGNIPLLPLTLAPATTTDVIVVLQPKDSSALLVTATDESGAPLYDATVTISKSGVHETRVTGIHSLSQTDWSTNNFLSKSDYVQTSNMGLVRLMNNAGSYPTSSEWLISNTIDLGTSQTQLLHLDWNGITPVETGGDSILFQIAANNDAATWNFVGPDGSPSTYYTSSGMNTYSGHDGNRYVRYKVFLHTEDKNYTPTLNDVSLYFSSQCIPKGQALFSGLSTGIYSVAISKSGYQTVTSTNVAVSENWQEYKALIPKQ